MPQAERNTCMDGGLGLERNKGADRSAPFMSRGNVYSLVERIHERDTKCVVCVFSSARLSVILGQDACPQSQCVCHRDIQCQVVENDSVRLRPDHIGVIGDEQCPSSVFL